MATLVESRLIFPTHTNKETAVWLVSLQVQGGCAAEFSTNKQKKNKNQTSSDPKELESWAFWTWRRTDLEACNGSTFPHSFQSPFSLSFYLFFVLLAASIFSFLVWRFTGEQPGTDLHQRSVSCSTGHLI